MDFQSGPAIHYKSYTTRAQVGAAQAYYAGGYYFAPAADSNRNQGATSVTLGAANVPYAAHVFIVAKQAGTATGGSGEVTVTVAGTTITDAGVRAASQTVTMVTDITALTANGYVETPRKFIGAVVIKLEVGSTGHTAYALDFNYGFCKYEDFGNRPFTISELECVGFANASDGGYQIELIHHKVAGWTYHASAFVPGPTAIKLMRTIHGTESDLDANEPYAFKVTNINQAVDGAGVEGVIVRHTTTANNAVEFVDTHIGVLL